MATGVSEKETGKETESRTFPIDRTLWWQRPNAATQRPVDSSKVQTPWNHDWTRPVDTDWTQPEFGHLALMPS